ncbi:putative orfan [Tupanvirus soda lake]|uniref:Orfan n=2 Tax=Tupanvirus TaxID=2094720 RepID=A0AC62ABP2_9VIRU|nr:putative orfan [Tupanvirus soda lake]QKU35211.1 putative orfan [Tupanvirus soda lake]
MDKKCVLINQGCAGFIHPASPSGATHIATFGAGPCIAGTFIIEKYSYVGLFHVSTTKEAANLMTLVYSMMNSLHSFIDKKNEKISLKVYLRAGYIGISEETRDVILNLPFHYVGFHPIFVDESCSPNSILGSHSLMVDLNGNILDYTMTNLEVFDECDALSAILSGMTGKINIVCNDYACTTQIIDIGSLQFLHQSKTNLFAIILDSRSFHPLFVGEHEFMKIEFDAADNTKDPTKKFKKNVEYQFRKQTSKNIYPKKQKMPKQRINRIHQPC